jgi:hypothetical protein
MNPKGCRERCLFQSLLISASEEGHRISESPFSIAADEGAHGVLKFGLPSPGAADFRACELPQTVRSCFPRSTPKGTSGGA